jgi:D-lyxose ketol-isomerase
MHNKAKHNQAVIRTIEYFDRAGIVLTEKEKGEITVFDFDFDELERVGLQLLVYVNTTRVCAKELVLFPGQSCVEHHHPTLGDVPGKEETFRCRWGEVYLYVPGPETTDRKAIIPDSMKDAVTVFHEIILRPGQQHTLYPDTPHWFQGGPEGAVISEFSTTNTDTVDRFTDPRIKRV